MPWVSIRCSKSRIPIGMQEMLYQRCDQDNAQDPTESRRRRQEAPPLDPAGADELRSEIIGAGFRAKRGSAVSRPEQVAQANWVFSG